MLTRIANLGAVAASAVIVAFCTVILALGALAAIAPFI